MAQVLKIALVGPCASGKSALASGLRAAGVGCEIRQPAQEHSYVANMWQRMTRPDLLIYLDVNFEHTRARRPKNHGGPGRLAEQTERLAHARAHCDFYVDTSGLTPQEVKTAVLDFLQQTAAS